MNLSTQQNVNGLRSVRRRLRQSGSGWLWSLLVLFGLGVGHASAEMGNSPAFGMQQRIACQTAIADVRWSHSLWPKENPAPKPARAEILSEDSIMQQVEDSLRQETALNTIYGVNITQPMIQGELRRVAAKSRMPGRLKEMFQALDNDPVKIAECLIRPTLVKRTLRQRYLWDKNQHGNLRRSAEQVLMSRPGVARLKQTGAREVLEALVLAGRQAPETGQADRKADRFATRVLDQEAFDRAAARLTAQATSAFSGSGLRETETAFVYEELLKQEPGRLEVRVLVWPKQDFNTWWGEESKHWTAPRNVRGFTDIRLPTIKAASVGYPEDSWRAIEFPEPQQRREHTAVWTGNEMIVWGGSYYDGERRSWDYLDSGGRYDPVTDLWQPTSRANAPSGRHQHTAVWTGSEMIIWGGANDASGPVSSLSTGARYAPATDSWQPVSLTNAPIPRQSHTAVWTGSEMIVWGGNQKDNGKVSYLASGGRYDPATDSWQAVSLVNAPNARDQHTAVWTGSEMVIWGGSNANGAWDTGGRYDPQTDSWLATSRDNVPVGRHNHTAVWTGNEMIIWGGHYSLDSVGELYPVTGGRYDPNTDAWVPTSTQNAPSGREYHTAIWTGEKMIVWGGKEIDGGATGSGGLYDPASDSWAATETINAPSPREKHTVVWTGSEMMVWAGERDEENVQLNTLGRYDPSNNEWRPTTAAPDFPDSASVWTGNEIIFGPGRFDPAMRYDPATDSWQALSSLGAPSGRSWYSLIWTGGEAILWGGCESWLSCFSSGARYNPFTDEWKAVSQINAPSERHGHSAVWTGTELIIWGGYHGGYLNTGSRYDPSADSWQPVSITGAPSVRFGHSAIWTGTEMIIWGGQSSDGRWNTGGRYDPLSDSWQPVSETGAPEKRSWHAAVWTGDTMIIWGGEDRLVHESYPESGGRYDPQTDTWQPVSLQGSPEGRRNFSAVWTGHELLVWGGRKVITDGGGGAPDPVFGPDWYSCVAHYYNSGGRYDPETDSWVATNLAGAPAPRSFHATIWTGRELIVLGGGNSNSDCTLEDSWRHLRDGGIYYPYGSFRFLDVAPFHWAYQWIETVSASGITTGCDADHYCPDSPVNRAQMAAFLTKGSHGAAYVPPAATGLVFWDVPSTYWAASWIEQLAEDGITSGCGDRHYCPEEEINRAQMAIYLLRSLHGADYIPPPADGSQFDDVPATYWAASWIEELAAEGIASGCDANHYCPEASVNRDQMAVFLARTFNL